MAFDLLYPHSSRRRNLIDLRGTVAFRGGRLIVNTPKSGKLRTVDTPGSLIAALRDRYSIRQAEAAVAGGEPSPWVFPSATDPTNLSMTRGFVTGCGARPGTARARSRRPPYLCLADAPTGRSRRLREPASRPLVHRCHRGPLRPLRPRRRPPPCRRAGGRDRDGRNESGRDPRATGGLAATDRRCVSA